MSSGGPNQKTNYFFISLILLLAFFLYKKFAYEKLTIPNTNQDAKQEVKFDFAHDLSQDKNSSIQKNKSVNPLSLQMISKETSKKSREIKPPNSQHQLAKIHAPQGSPGDDLKQADEILNFKLEDGVAVTAGDIVLGKPTEAVPTGKGFAAAPDLQLWPSTDIPIFVQSGIKDPDRIDHALSMFDETPIHFVRIEPTEGVDALMFIPGTKTCKSYLGKIGGVQPIWIADSCSAADIAHELMHALGFLHEQNRTDRDEFVNISWKNIDPEYRINFELFPTGLMTASGTGDFDFESIMMYPLDAFSIHPGLKTIQAKNNQQIGKNEPPFMKNEQLSSIDKMRIQRVYGNR